jgi:hypothetical protein
VIRAILVAALLTGAFSLSENPQTVSTYRILFVGNSLTAANALPKMVEALGTARGNTVEIITVAVNNFSLEDHWNHGEVRNAIARGNWTHVVLQQGPSSLPESRALLRDYVKRFAGEAAKIGARITLYMVWPAKPRQRDFDAVSESYRLAAQDVDGVILPAGDAWREAWKLDPSLELYAEDGFHPSRPGSYLAALTIWRGLSGESVVGLPPVGIDGTDAQTIKILQTAAERQFVSGSRRLEFVALR